MRTATSRTYITKSGTYETHFSAAPVNYRTRSGSWHAMPTHLTPSGSGAVAADEGTFDASFPATSTGWVRVSDGDAKVNSTMADAAAVGVHSAGTTATYPNVYADTDAVYDVGASTVEETLVLKSTDAPASFQSHLTVATGSTLRSEDDGSISVLDSDGSVEAVLPTPVMQDASGNLDTDTSTAVSFAVSGSSPNYTLTVTPSHAWLTDPARVYPVRLDPTVTFAAGGTVGCYYTDPHSIYSGGAAATDPTVCSYGAGGTDNYLQYGQIGHARRIFLKFPDITDPSLGIQANAVVTAASLTLTEITANSPTTAVQTWVQRAGGTWGSGNSWSTLPSPVNNSSADDPSQRVDDVSVTPPGAGQTLTFAMASAVRGWVNGKFSNDGIEIRLRDGDEASASNLLRFYGSANATAANRPTLTVSWQPTVGQQQWVGAYDHSLSDRMDLHVDLASRNLVLNNTDEQLAAPGTNLVVRRTYNSKLAYLDVTGAYGAGWSMNGGVDTGITVSRAQVVVTQPGGAVAWFTRNFNQSSLTVKQKDHDSDNESWTPSPGMKADLIQNDSTHYQIYWRKSHQVASFTLPSSTSTTGYLASMGDGRGNATSYSVGGSPLHTSSATDSTGQRSVSMTYTTGRVTGMSESLVGGTNQRSWTYTYNTGLLTQYTDPTSHVTRYCYNAAGLISRIITPRGVANGSTCTTNNGLDVTDISYDAYGGVNSITYMNGTGSGASPITVSFATTVPLNPGGSSGQVTETDPYGKVTTYHFDQGDRITEVDTPLGYHTSATFNENNDVTASVDYSNFTGGGSDPATTAQYDSSGFGNLENVTSPGGVSIDSDFSSSADPYQPNAVADDRDQDTSSTQATDYDYNSTGQIKSATKGNTTIYVRHQGDSGVSNCGPGSTPAAAYTGAVCETRDPLYDSSVSTAEHRTLYSYDSLGEMVRMTPPQPDNGRSTPADSTYTYDNHSRLASITDSLGQTTSFTYDALDRMTRTTYASGKYTEYTYDEDGNRKFVGDHASSGTLLANTGHSWTYDNLNRLATDSQDNYAAVTYTWDGNSRLIKLDDGSGVGPINYGYNADGAVTSMSEPGGSCSGFSLTSLPTSGSGCILFDVDKSRRRLRTIYPGDAAEQRQTYDSDGKINTVQGVGHTSGGSGTTFFDFTYGYDTGSGSTLKHTNHLQVRRDAVSNTREEYVYAYTGKVQIDRHYDSAYDGFGTNTAVWVHCYDVGGNLRFVSNTVGDNCTHSPDRSYDGANQQLGTGHSYDDNGQELSNVSGVPVANTTRTTTWNERQQPDSLSISSLTMGSTYAGAGSQEMLTTDTSGTGQDQLHNLGSSLTELVHTETGSGVTMHQRYDRDPGGNLIAIRSINGSTTNYYWPLADARGSVLRVLDTSGVVVDQYHYDAGGAIGIDANAVPEPLGYLAGYANSGSGLSHFGARFYDPSLTAFTQHDPKTHDTDPTQPNPYAYAGDDPLNRTDLTGAWSLSLSGSICAFGGCIGGTIGVDSDGDVSLGADLGVGTPGVGGGLGFDPEGNYSQGFDASETAGCTAGPVTEGFNSDGDVYTSVNDSYASTPSCQATVNGSYTF